MIRKITFEELVDAAAENSDSSKAFTRRFIKEMAAVIRDGLNSDGVVNISGFGIFKLNRVDSRQGRNPQTGEDITIPAHNKVLFKPEKSIRELINKKYKHLRPQIIEKQKEPSTTTTVGASFFDEPHGEKAAPKASETTTGKDVSPPKEEKTDIRQETPVPAQQADDNSKKRRVLPIATALIIVLILVLFIYDFDGDDAIDRAEKTPSQQTTEQVSSVAAEAPAEAQQQVREAIPQNKEIQQTTQNDARPMPENHTIETGENLWELAQRYYDDGYKWPLILLANQENISNPDLIPEGIEIKIPTIEKKTGTPDSELKSRLAQGHLIAYTLYKNKDEEAALNHLYVAYRYDSGKVDASVADVDAGDIQRIRDYPNTLR